MDDILSAISLIILGCVVILVIINIIRDDDTNNDQEG